MHSGRVYDAQICEAGPQVQWYSVSHFRSRQGLVMQIETEPTEEEAKLLTFQHMTYIFTPELAGAIYRVIVDNVIK